LAAHVLEELVQGALDGLHDVRFELLEAVLDGYEVLAVVVFFEDLLVQAVVDAALEEIGVVRLVDFSGGRVKAGRVLAEHLDVPLSHVAGFINVFGGFACARLQFLGLVLDFGVEAREDGQDGPLEVLLRLEVHVRHALSITPNILEQPRHTTQLLCEMMSLLQWVANRLQDLLVLLGLGTLDLLGGSDVVLKVAAHVLPCLEALDEKAGCGAGIGIGDCLIVGEGIAVAQSAGWEMCLSHGN